MTPIEYIKHGYIQDLDYFGKVGGSPHIICGITAPGLVNHYESFINSAYFIAMVAELWPLKGFLDCYFGEYSLNLPIIPDPHCGTAHGGIGNVFTMLSYFEREISDSRYVPNDRQLYEFSQLLVKEYVHGLSMKSMDDFAFRDIKEHFSYRIDEVAEAIIAGYLHETDNKSFPIFLKFQERYEKKVAIRREIAAQARRLFEEKENEIKIAAKERRTIRATGNLYNAIRRGDERAVKALLLHDADVNTLTPNGEKLLDFARRKGNSEIIGLLKHQPLPVESRSQQARSIPTIPTVPRMLSTRGTVGIAAIFEQLKQLEEEAALVAAQKAAKKAMRKLAKQKAAQKNQGGSH